MYYADPSFYETLSVMGEAMLMGALDALEEPERIAGFEAFVKTIEKEGVPNPFFEENLAIDTVKAVGDDDSDRREMDHGSTTFARQIAEAMATPAANDQELAWQASWVKRIHDKMPDKNLRQRLADSTLFEFCSRNGRPELMDDMVHFGANPDKPQRSRKKTEIHEYLTCFGEAVANSQLAKAMALMPVTNPDQITKTMGHIAKGHPPAGGQHQQVFVESVSMARLMIHQGRAPLVLEFLDRLDAVDGQEKARDVRAAVLKSYLQCCQNSGKPWDGNTLELLCTKHSPSSHASLWKDFHDLFDGPGTPSAMTFGSWMHLARDAVYVGCAPVLEALSPMIRQQSVNGACAGLDLAKAVGDTPMGDAYVPDQFKAAMSVLAAQGLSMNITGPDDVPLAYNVVLSRHALAKLSILLELGMDPKAQQPGKPNQKPVTDFIMDPNVKERWESIVRSFEARKTANSLLAELDGPSP